MPNNLCYTFRKGKRDYSVLKGETAMFFDPISTWLVTLLADGVIISNEKFGRKVDFGEWERECIMRHNRELNDAIRCVRKYNGYSEEAYNKIRNHIVVTASYYPSNGSYEYIRIDLDNQEYIISVLEECLKTSSEKLDEASQKRAEGYKQALTTAKNLYNEARTQREEQKATDTGCIIWLIIGFCVLLVFIGVLLWLRNNVL